MAKYDNSFCAFCLIAFNHVIIIWMGKRQNKNKMAAHNRIYFRNERAIQKAVFSLIGRYRGRLTARQVAKAAGLAWRTVHRHCSDFDSVIAESEDAILSEFSACFDENLQKLQLVRNQNARLFYAMMVYMAHRRDVFCPICSDLNNQGILYRMTESVYQRLEIVWLPKGSPTPALESEKAKMLMRIIVEVLCEWSASTNCNVRKANRFVRRMLQAVSDAAANRLP